MIGCRNVKGRMLSEDAPSRDDQIGVVATQFVLFIDTQTGAAPPEPHDVGASELLSAFEALDESLNQLADLADVYGTDRMQAIEPLVLPTAALVGEYLRHATGARWVDPVIDAETTLIIATTGGVAVDLTGAVRASLLSGVSNLKTMVDRLINPETP